MTVWITYRDKTYQVPADLSVRETLLRIGIVPETVIPTEKGQLVDEETLLVEGQVIKLVPVISGGAGNLVSGGDKPTNRLVSGS